MQVIPRIYIVHRFIILRCKNGVTGLKAEKIANALEQTLYDRHVQFVVRQRNDDASAVAVVGATATKIEGVLRRLAEKSFDYGPSPSDDVIMREGQEITIRFRGNIKSSDDKKETKLVFNSNIKTKLNITAVVCDTFAQKSIDCYRGFIQIYTAGPQLDQTQEGASREGGQVKMAAGEILVSELLINLPKVSKTCSHFGKMYWYTVLSIN